jgi:formylglycine-generating enzyme required for sulfatase activity
VVVNGDVSGNLIIGDHNVVDKSVTQPTANTPAAPNLPGLHSPLSLSDININSNSIIHEHVPLTRSVQNVGQEKLSNSNEPKTKNDSRIIEKVSKEPKSLAEAYLAHAEKTKQSQSTNTKSATQKESQKLKPEHRVAITVAIIGAIATLLAALIGILPQFLSLPGSNITNNPTFTATPWLGEITDPKGVTMRLVPAGEFTIGSDDYSDDEKPAHTVYLDDFYVDIYEVTNALYKTCVDAGACTLPGSTRSSTRTDYYGNPAFNNYPVIYVDWNQAKTYCEWRFARLPTEAEWEKAARSADGRTYPWGNNAPDKTLLNYNNNIGDTSAVGSYLGGRSPYGMYDMSGNVWEWVADWYSETYYGTLGENAFDPQGPASGSVRVLRGGAWYYSNVNTRSAYRSRYVPGDRLNGFGFRCALSP